MHGDNHRYNDILLPKYYLINPAILHKLEINNNQYLVLSFLFKTINNFNCVELAQISIKILKKGIVSLFWFLIWADLSFFKQCDCNISFWVVISWLPFTLEFVPYPCQPDQTTLTRKHSLQCTHHKSSSNYLDKRTSCTVQPFY